MREFAENIVFESLQPAAADAILKLIKEYRDDSRDNKIDLGVGVYRTAEGDTPVLSSVKKAEQILVDTQDSKAYIGTAGAADFNRAIQQLIFGTSEWDDRLLTVQTPGGSGSLRVAAGIILRAREAANTWVGEPTWANHFPLLASAGMTLKPYPYYDTDRHVIKADAMLEALNAAPRGDLVLLHACCHNPSGLDPTAEQWRQIADIIVDRELLPFVDMAYQGFATDLDADAFIIRHLAERVPEMVVSSSCSKNFGLYRDRVGALSILSADTETRDTLSSQASNLVRTLYSMPPDHGAAIVSTILHTTELRNEWAAEVDAMRARLRDMRELLGAALQKKAPQQDFSHLARATGMFCFLGVSAEQVERLKSEHGVYMVNSSRINVAGITTENVEYLAESIAAVV